MKRSLCLVKLFAALAVILMVCAPVFAENTILAGYTWDGSSVTGRPESYGSGNNVYYYKWDSSGVSYLGSSTDSEFTVKTANTTIGRLSITANTSKVEQSFLNNNPTPGTGESSISGSGLFNEYEVGSVTGSFVNNFASIGTGTAKGGALYNVGKITGAVEGDFIGNKASTDFGSAYGGAVYNADGEGTTIGSITGDFVKNTVLGVNKNNNVDAHGGAIYNSKHIGNITGNFVENSASATSQVNHAYSYGGAITNTGLTAAINDITGNFIGNSASAIAGAGLSNEQKSEMEEMLQLLPESAGGAIYNDFATIGNITGSFIGNSTTGNGGAIYNSGTITLTTKKNSGFSTLLFKDNIDSDLDPRNAVYNTRTGKFTIKAEKDASVTFDADSKQNIYNNGTLTLGATDGDWEGTINLSSVSGQGLGNATTNIYSGKVFLNGNLSQNWLKITKRYTDDSKQTVKTLGELTTNASNLNVKGSTTSGKSIYIVNDGIINFTSGTLSSSIADKKVQEGDSSVTVSEEGITNIAAGTSDSKTSVEFKFNSAGRVYQKELNVKDNATLRSNAQSLIITDGIKVSTNGGTLVLDRHVESSSIETNSYSTLCSNVYEFDFDTTTTENPSTALLWIKKDRDFGRVAAADNVTINLKTQIGYNSDTASVLLLNANQLLEKAKVDNYGTLFLEEGTLNNASLEEQIAAAKATAYEDSYVVGVTGHSGSKTHVLKENSVTFNTRVNDTIRIDETATLTTDAKLIGGTVYTNGDGTSTHVSNTVMNNADTEQATLNVSGGSVIPSKLQYSVLGNMTDANFTGGKTNVTSGKVELEYTQTIKPRLEQEYLNVNSGAEFTAHLSQLRVYNPHKYHNNYNYNSQVEAFKYNDISNKGVLNLYGSEDGYVTLKNSIVDNESTKTGVLNFLGGKTLVEVYRSTASGADTELRASRVFKQKALNIAKEATLKADVTAFSSLTDGEIHNAGTLELKSDRKNYSDETQAHPVENLTQNITGITTITGYSLDNTVTDETFGSGTFYTKNDTPDYAQTADDSVATGKTYYTRDYEVVTEEAKKSENFSNFYVYDENGKMYIKANSIPGKAYSDSETYYLPKETYSAVASPINDDIRLYYEAFDKYTEATEFSSTAEYYTQNTKTDYGTTKIVSGIVDAATTPKTITQNALVVDNGAELRVNAGNIDLKHPAQPTDTSFDNTITNAGTLVLYGVADNPDTANVDESTVLSANISSVSKEDFYKPETSKAKENTDYYQATAKEGLTVGSDEVGSYYTLDKFGNLVKASGKAQENVTYYEIGSALTFAKQTVTVNSTDVSNFYTFDNNGNFVQASDKAQSGVDYYSATGATPGKPLYNLTASTGVTKIADGNHIKIAEDAVIDQNIEFNSDYSSTAATKTSSITANANSFGTGNTIKMVVNAVPTAAPGETVEENKKLTKATVYLTGTGGILRSDIIDGITPTVTDNVRQNGVEAVIKTNSTVALGNSDASAKTLTIDHLKVENGATVDLSKNNPTATGYDYTYDTVVVDTFEAPTGSEEKAFLSFDIGRVGDTDVFDKFLLKTKAGGNVQIKSVNVSDTGFDSDTIVMFGDASSSAVDKSFAAQTYTSASTATEAGEYYKLGTPIALQTGTNLSGYYRISDGKLVRATGTLSEADSTNYYEAPVKEIFDTAPASALGNSYYKIDDAPTSGLSITGTSTVAGSHMYQFTQDKFRFGNIHVEKIPLAGWTLQDMIATRTEFGDTTYSIDTYSFTTDMANGNHEYGFVWDTTVPEGTTGASANNNIGKKAYLTSGLGTLLEYGKNGTTVVPNAGSSTLISPRTFTLNGNGAEIVSLDTSKLTGYTELTSASNVSSTGTAPLSYYVKDKDGNLVAATGTAQSGVNYYKPESVGTKTNSEDVSNYYTLDASTSTYKKASGNGDGTSTYYSSGLVKTYFTDASGFYGITVNNTDVLNIENLSFNGFTNDAIRNNNGTVNIYARKTDNISTPVVSFTGSSIKNTKTLNVNGNGDETDVPTNGTVKFDTISDDATPTGEITIYGGTAEFNGNATQNKVTNTESATLTIGTTGSLTAKELTNAGTLNNSATLTVDKFNSNGSISNFNNSIININGDSKIDSVNTSSDFGFNPYLGTVNVNAGGSLVVSNLLNTGSLNIAAESDSKNAGSVTIAASNIKGIKITNNGILNLHDGTGHDKGALSSNISGTGTLNVNDTITSSGTITQGTINVVAGDAAATGKTLTNNGTITAGDLSIGKYSKFDNSGTVTADKLNISEDSKLVNSASKTATVKAVTGAAVENAGTFNVNANAANSYGLTSLTGAGSTNFNIDNGIALAVSNDITQTTVTFTGMSAADVYYERSNVTGTPTDFSAADYYYLSGDTYVKATTAVPGTIPYYQFTAKSLAEGSNTSEYYKKTVDKFALHPLAVNGTEYFNREEKTDLSGDVSGQGYFTLSDGVYTAFDGAATEGERYYKFTKVESVIEGADVSDYFISKDSSYVTTNPKPTSTASATIAASTITADVVNNLGSTNGLKFNGTTTIVGELSGNGNTSVESGKSLSISADKLKLSKGLTNAGTLVLSSGNSTPAELTTAIIGSGSETEKTQIAGGSSIKFSSNVGQAVEFIGATGTTSTVTTDASNLGGNVTNAGEGTANVVLTDGILTKNIKNNVSTTLDDDSVVIFGAEKSTADIAVDNLTANANSTIDLTNGAINTLKVKTLNALDGSKIKFDMKGVSAETFGTAGTGTNKYNFTEVSLSANDSLDGYYSYSNDSYSPASGAYSSGTYYKRELAEDGTYFAQHNAVNANDKIVITTASTTPGEKPVSGTISLSSINVLKNEGDKVVDLFGNEPSGTTNVAKGKVAQLTLIDNSVNNTGANAGKDLIDMTINGTTSSTEEAIYTFKQHFDGDVESDANRTGILDVTIIPAKLTLQNIIAANTRVEGEEYKIDLFSLSEDYQLGKYLMKEEGAEQAKENPDGYFQTTDTEIVTGKKYFEKTANGYVEKAFGEISGVKYEFSSDLNRQAPLNVLTAYTGESTRDLTLSGNGHSINAISDVNADSGATALAGKGITVGAGNTLTLEDLGMKNFGVADAETGSMINNTGTVNIIATKDIKYEGTTYTGEATTAPRVYAFKNGSETVGETQVDGVINLLAATGKTISFGTNDNILNNAELNIGDANHKGTVELKYVDGTGTMNVNAGTADSLDIKQGSLTVAKDATLNVTGSITTTDEVSNEGTLKVKNGEADGDITATGDISNTGTAALITAKDISAANITNEGTITASGDITATSLTNTGTINVAASDLKATTVNNVVEGSESTTGILNLSAGNLASNISGTGTLNVNGDIASSGTVEQGTINVAESKTLTNNGTITADVVSGNAVVNNGSFNINFSADDSYSLRSLTGTGTTNFTVADGKTLTLASTNALTQNTFNFADAEGEQTGKAVVLTTLTGKVNNSMKYLELGNDAKVTGVLSNSGNIAVTGTNVELESEFNDAEGEGNVEVKKDALLTIAAGNLKLTNGIENNGTLGLKAGTLTSKVFGTGTLSINEAVVNGSKEEITLKQGALAGIGSFENNYNLVIDVNEYSLETLSGSGVTTFVSTDSTDEAPINVAVTGTSIEQSEINFGTAENNKGTFTVSVDIEADVNNFIEKGITLNNNVDGSVTNNEGAILVFGGNTTVTKDVVNNGTMSIAEGATKLAVNDTLTNKSTFVAEAGDSVAEKLVNTGIFGVDNGAKFTVNTSLTNDDATILNFGTFTLGNDPSKKMVLKGTVDGTNDGGSTPIMGSLVVNSDLTNEGTIKQDELTVKDSASLVSKLSAITLASNTLHNNGRVEFTDVPENTFTLNVDTTANGVALPSIRFSEAVQDICLNSRVEGNEIFFKNGTLTFGSIVDIDSSTLTLQDGAELVDLHDGDINRKYNLGTLKLNTDVKFNMEMDLKNVTMDSITVTEDSSTEGGSGLIVAFNSDKMVKTKSPVLKFHPFTDDVSRVALKDAFDIKPMEKVLTPIFYYTPGYDKDEGVITLTADNNFDGYNPALFAPAIAAEVEGYYGMAANFEDVFANADMALMTKVQDRAWDAWAKPTLTVETVDLVNGPEVGNTTFGVTFGKDSRLFERVNGIKALVSGFAGLDKSIIRYSDMKLDGTTVRVGGKGMLYYGNFYVGGAIQTGVSMESIDTEYGLDEFTMLSAGLSGKVGFNWNFLNGGLVIQPNATATYAFVGQSDYTTKGDVFLSNDPLTSVQVIPALKVIGNLSNNWQAYLNGQYVKSLRNATKTIADSGVEISSLSVDQYFQYGLGVQKCLADNVVFYVNINGRLDGRAGITATAGVSF